MARSPRIFALAADAITIEGALIAPAMLAKVAAREAEGQSDAGYRIPKGLTLRDEIARYFRIGQALFAELNASNAPSVGKTVTFAEALLRDVFGFTDITRVGSRMVDERLYAVTLEGLSGRAPIVVVPPSESLDRASDHLPTDGRRRSAATALQDWLNAQEGTLWGFCCNGERLRLLRDNASLTRPAYIEADLRQIFDAESFADFTVLWLLIHASRFGAIGTPASDCALERWREAGGREGAAARERLRDGVEAALKTLGTGFLTSNSDLRQRIQTGDLPLSDFFGQLLRLVYRLIFLLAAEDRSLLHTPDASPAARMLYGQGYSLSSLRDRAIRRTAWDAYHDKWEGLVVVFTALARGEKLLGLPALGGLFGLDMMPVLETAQLMNRTLMEAIFRLAWLREDGGLVPVNWRDMETEELGSVYEGLLELTPRLVENGRGFAFAEGGEAKGHARKTSGSYYTPDSLVQALLDTSLDPVLDQVEAVSDDSATALLGVTVIDPACGSGHFLLAAGRRIATRLARARTGGVASAEDYRHALRDVARACLHGVDRNPMAVELSKVALWIETVEPGKPLGFFDANIRCGDSLLGVFDLAALEKGISDNAYKPLAGDDKAVARYYAQKNRRETAEREHVVQGFSLNKQRDLMRDFAKLRQMPEDTPDEIAAKAARLKGLTSAGATGWTLARACDLYVSAFLAPKVVVPQTAGPEGLPRRGAETVATSGTVWELLRGVQPFGLLMQQAERALSEVRPFHWPLEFPDVMAAGGFDVVLGNPPWERIKLQEQEFFAARDPGIATAPNAATRNRLIAKLKEAAPGTRERALYEEFEAAKRTAEASSVFARNPVEEGGRFPLTGRGDVNTYALFAELFASLGSKRGRGGVVVPTGIATDITTAPFFEALVSKKRLAQLIDFENRERLFPAIDSRMKFSLLTTARDVEHAGFAFFLTDPHQLAEEERRFTLSAEDIARINPNTKTAPVFRSRADAEVTAKIYDRVPVLIDESKGEAGNPWAISVHTRLWHMAEDSEWFRTSSELSATGFKRDGAQWVAAGNSKNSGSVYVPLYEAKMINFYDHRFGSYGARVDGRGYRVLPETTAFEYANVSFEPESYYFVPKTEVETRLTPLWERNWLIAFKDVTAATNERTAIFSFLPRTAVGHSAPLLLPSVEPRFAAVLVAALNSIVVDYCARSKVGGLHLTIGILAQFPVLPPSCFSAVDLAFIVTRVLELTYTSHSMAPFARDLGYDGQPFKWDENRRATLRAELDAFYARAYGVNRDELRYILDPADVRGADYPSETFRVLKTNEIRRFGEYRTARLVLDAWDRMERGELSVAAAPIAVRPAEPVRAMMPVVDAAALPDLAWARTGQPQQGDTGAALAAILKAINGPRPAREIRLAGALALEPRLVVPLLSDSAASQWRRLVGTEADLLPTNVPGFVARINAGWGAAVRNLRGNGRLIEDPSSGTWAPGSGLEAIDTNGWPDGRASFILFALSGIDLTSAVSALPNEIQQWIADVAAA